jgi:hypothetical protein
VPYVTERKANAEHDGSERWLCAGLFVVGDLVTAGLRKLERKGLLKAVACSKCLDRSLIQFRRLTQCPFGSGTAELSHTDLEGWSEQPGSCMCIVRQLFHVF